MKLVMIFLMVVCSFLQSNAQLEKGTWLVGGAGDFYASKRNYASYIMPSTNGYSKEFNLSLYPNIGYFVADRFAIGVRPFFSWSKGEFYPDDPLYSGGTSNSKRYGIGPFARYYFLDKEKPFNILSDVSYQTGTLDQGGKGKLNNFSFLVGPVIYFNTSVGLEVLLGYRNGIEELKNYSKNSSSSFAFNIGFQVHLTK